MRALHGRLLVGGELRVGTISVDAGRIVALEFDASAAEDAHALPVVAPGFIDLHVHGFDGAEPVEGLEAMARALAAQGTTAFLPTLFPDDPARLGRTAESVWARAESLMESARAESRAPLARPLGLHLEGPFVNPRSAGALPVSALAEPSPAALRELLGPSDGSGRGIRAITLAPELPGAADLVAELVRSGIRVSLGHSRASAAEARVAAAGGARTVTHLFNAMSGVHHREMGLAGFALTEEGLTCELIGDLVHVGPEAIELALRARGPRGLALVSDALAGAGTGCEVFESHGHTCRALDGAFWFDDPSVPSGRRLAGAAASQLEAVRRLVGRGVVSLADALSMASEAPARALGIEAERGLLAPGLRADLVVLGANLELQEVLVGA